MITATPALLASSVTTPLTLWFSSTPLSVLKVLLACWVISLKVSIISDHFGGNANHKDK